MTGSHEQRMLMYGGLVSGLQAIAQRMSFMAMREQFIGRMLGDDDAEAA